MELSEIFPDLGYRATRCLVNHGIRTTGQLASMDAAKMLSIRGFGEVSSARVDAALTRIGMCPGGGDWAELWRRNRCRAAARRIYAAVDAQTPEWRLAMVTDFAERVGESGEGEICDYDFWQLADLANLDADDELHIRCYAAMILARDRQVAMLSQQCDCFKFQGLVCPEHRVTGMYDICFMCEGCGSAYGACECDEAIRDRVRDDGRHHTLV